MEEKIVRETSRKVRYEEKKKTCSSSKSNRCRRTNTREPFREMRRFAIVIGKLSIFSLKRLEMGLKVLPPARWYTFLDFFAAAPDVESVLSRENCETKMPANALRISRKFDSKTLKYLFKILGNDWYWVDRDFRNWFHSTYLINLIFGLKNCSAKMRTHKISTSERFADWIGSDDAERRKKSVRLVRVFFVFLQFQPFFPHSSNASRFVTIYGHIWSSALVRATVGEVVAGVEEF